MYVFINSIKLKKEIFGKTRLKKRFESYLSSIFNVQMKNK